MRHKIEDAVRVYLILSEDRKSWEVDPTSFDMALFSDYDNGAINEDCMCDDKAECGAIVTEANHIELPSGQELILMLQTSYAAHLARKGRQDELSL
jgi:hypothetical protein